MASMTLTLSLKGVGNLIQSIQALNKSLTQLNTTLNNTASKIQGIANAIGQIKPPPPPPRPSRAKNPGGQGGQNSPNTQSNQSQGKGLSWVLNIIPTNVRGFAGGIFNAGRIVVTGLKWLSSASMGAVLALGTFTAGLLALGYLLYSISKSKEVIAERSKLFYSSFGNEKVADVGNKIAKAAGISPDKMAQMAGQTPGGMATIIKYLEILRQQDPRLRGVTAEKLGITDLLPLTDLSKKSWDEMMNPERKPRGYNQPSRTAGAENEAAKGRMSKAWDEYWLNKTLVGLETGVYNSIANFLQPKAVGIPSGLEGKKSDKTADKQMDAANKLNEAADKMIVFTDKVGIIGGGNRARGAMPTAWEWFTQQQYMIYQERTMGAFEY